MRLNNLKISIESRACRGGLHYTRLITSERRPSAHSDAQERIERSIAATLGRAGRIKRPDRRESVG